MSDQVVRKTYNIAQAKASAGCDHPVVVREGRDGVELHHYGAATSRDEPLAPKGDQTETGFMVAAIKKYHKQDEREEQDRERRERSAARR